MNKKEEDKTVCTNCSTQISKITGKLNLTPQEIELLKRPRRSFTFNIPLRMDDGRVEYFNGYRVQYSDALGPTKGGIRFHPHVEIEEVKILSFLMSLKTALVGIPFGGAKGGIEVDPNLLSKPEKERLSRNYIREIHRFIGPNYDIPAPDVNTDGEVMSWMMDEYSKIKGRFTPGVITGKPIHLGGSQGREISTSRGGAFILKRWAQKNGKDLKKLKVAVQGFGNVGANIAKILHGWGVKVIAVTDHRGGYHNPEGIDIPALLARQDDKRLLPKLDCKKITNPELLELDVDVLIPAAISDQITEANADNIKANMILEMANAPVTPKADPILFKKGIEIIPDILANAGGVIVSYFEWVQNSMNDYWSEDAVMKKLEEKMNDAFDSIAMECHAQTCSMRDSSYAIAVRRILAAEKSRGNV